MTGMEVDDLRAAFTGGIASAVKPAILTNAELKETPKLSDSKTDTQQSAADSCNVDEGESPKRRKRAPKDPNAPKRPLNAFLKYRNQESKKISEERRSKGETDLSRADMSLTVKEHWEKLPESVRENLIQESKQELDRYHARLASYKESANAQDEDLLTQPETSQMLAQLGSSQPILASSQAEPSSPDSPPKKKQRRKDDSKKDEKDKKKKKKQASSE